MRVCYLRAVAERGGLGMDEFHFLRPLWLLIILPSLAIWWGLWRRQDRMAAWRQIVDSHLIRHLIVGEPDQGRLRPIHLLLLVWVVCGIALAGPSWRMEPSPFADDQAGLVVLLKVSDTMLASDVQPTRLERAKYKIRDLLELRQGSSAGMVVYSGSAHLLMPLTRDDRIINAMLEDLTPNLMPVDGDVLVEALKLAEQMLAKSGVPGSVLVVADSVSAAQVQVLSNTDIKLPVQILSVQTISATPDSGLQKAASILGAKVVKLTNDPLDVESVARRARAKLQTVSSRKDGSRWQDAGVTMLPFLALFILMWSRRGWLVT